MASIVSVVISDDLDGSPNAQSVTFGVDGVAYEIDLVEKHRAQFAKQLAPYVEAARKVNRRRPRGASAPQPSGRGDRTAVRSWAKEQGLKVSERGRISADVMQQYEAAH